MKKRLALVTRAVVLLVVLLGTSAPARAGDPVPAGTAAVVSATEVERACELARAGRMREALAAVRGGREALARPVEAQDERSRRLALAYSVLRAGCYVGDRQDEEPEVKRSIALADERVRPEDLPLLHELEAAGTRTAPFARALARAATARISAALDPAALTGFLRGEDPEARRRALAAICERLGRARGKVNAGGDLDAQEQRELTSSQLIAALIEALAWRSATDALPQDLAAQACGTALHALALVESPAIPMLEAARRRGAPGAEAALGTVREAALERVRRHPRSSWCSARGTLPAVIPDAVPCTGCGKPLPEGARFCPACGGSAPGVRCPRCGQAAVSDICPRCGGLARGELRSCGACGESLGAADAFCRRCGTRRGDAAPRSEGEPRPPAAPAPPPAPR